MNIRPIIFRCILVAAALILAFYRPTPAFAVSTVTISTAGNGVYLLQGIGIEDAAAVEINISYDVATLSNPRVVEGPLVAGAMTAVNPNIPGTVRIVMIRLTPFRGSGMIASVTFAQTGASPGRILAMSAHLADAKGSPLAAQVQVNNPPEALANASSASQDQSQSSGSSSAQAGAATSGSTAAIVPAVIIAGQPSRLDAAKESADAPQPGQKDVQLPVQAADSSQGKTPVDVSRADATGANIPAAPVKPNVRKIYGQKSVLELFQNYRGEKTAEALFALFEQESMIGFRQDPPVALSDGKSAVTVVFISTPGNLTTSDISVMGARLISLRRDIENTNTWVAELLPEKGGYRASMAVTCGEFQMIYPLTIAPKINIETGRAGKPSKADFDRYLKKAKTSIPNGKNVSSDNTPDYVKDYIMAANYFASVTKGTGPNVEASAARKNR